MEMVWKHVAGITESDQSEVIDLFSMLVVPLHHTRPANRVCPSLLFKQNLSSSNFFDGSVKVSDTSDRSTGIQGEWALEECKKIDGAAGVTLWHVCSIQNR